MTKERKLTKEDIDKLIKAVPGMPPDKKRRTLTLIRNYQSQAIQEDDPEARFNAIQRACLILLSLQSSLDHNNGGEIAKMLDSFYFSMDVRLMRQNREPNIELLDRVTKEIRMMRDAWADVDAQMTAAGKPDADSTEAAPSIETISSISVSA
jgi:flagellar protein FliS